MVDRRIARVGHHGPVSVWTIVVAAGSGERFGGPKQLMALGGRRVLDYAVGAATEASDGVVLVVPRGVDWDLGSTTSVPGGLTRSASVRCGLAAVPADSEIIVVHDAARPLADTDLFRAVIDAVRAGADAAIPGCAIADTIKRVDGDVVVATESRENLVTVQTPQAFRAEVLRAAHAHEPEGTDDAAVVEAAGGRVVVVAGPRDNLKITEPDDLRRAEALIRDRETRA